MKAETKTDKAQRAKRIRNLEKVFELGHTVAGSRGQIQAPVVVGPEQVNKIDATTVVPWNKVNKSHLGQQITVEGTIVEIGKSRTGKAHYLNFAPYKPGTTDFYLVVFESDFGKFGGDLEKLYKGKTVRVTGKVEEYQQRTQIKVTDPSQIQVVQPKEGAMFLRPRPSSAQRPQARAAA